ncbi:MAG: hypothetical protein K8R36_25090, partial [Planctomycetales bacterium]|nr:hypothetical protein [Planctomycetales bacterium]
MTTTDSKPSAAAQPFMEQRLDAIDRALLGILPRNERLAFVSQVETRVRELTNGNTAAESTAPSAMEPEMISDTVSRRTAAASPKRRSRLALSSGILGIVALVMLFAMPITYVLVMTVGEEFGEVVSISLLGIHVLTVAIGGLVALIMGIAGLISLSRRKGSLVGHGWAITGLCTAPLPTFVGGLLVLVTGFSLIAVRAVDVESGPTPRGVAVSPSRPTKYASAPANCAPASSMPAPMPATYPASAAACAPASSIPAPSFPKPLAVSAAPSFCPSGEVCSPSVRAAYSDDVLKDDDAQPTRVAPAPYGKPAALPPSSFSPPSPFDSNELALPPPAPTNPSSKVSPSGSNRPGAPTDLLDPPSDDEILRALDKAKPSQGGFLHSVERNNIRIVKEKVSGSVDPPCIVPLCGPVQLHHSRYKCTVYYTETTRVGSTAS